ncbi:hypothetical protein [Streptomyces oceani]|uniref:Uncharacterized protein n=1 Tax=Streptomyces oceani TaxID=1075402 RepID=A0A1E7KMV2_9ACTN|nr:hypothetical protein [Streptomyces oceani]OEV05151.1 hypothetical protein AN216_03975 [Streptomyces oceani]
MAESADEDVNARLVRAAELLEECVWRFWEDRNTDGIAGRISEARACYDAVDDATASEPGENTEEAPAGPELADLGFSGPGLPGAESGATVNAATVALGRSTAATLALRLCVDVDHDLNSGWDHDTEPPPLGGMAEEDPDGASEPFVAEAVSAARAALEADPDDPMAPLQLGHALAWSGDRDGAVAAYEKALWRDPWDGLARDCLRALEVSTPDPPPADLVRRRRYGFVLLRHEARASNSEWLTHHRLFGSVAAARADAEDVLRSSAGDLRRAELPDRLGLVLEVHRPSRPIARHDLVTLIPAEPDGGPFVIDWSTVPVDEPIEMPLPPGRMLRMGGETCFCYGTAKAPAHN